MVLFFFFKQKTAYEMRISDWSSDVCSSDLPRDLLHAPHRAVLHGADRGRGMADRQPRPTGRHAGRGVAAGGFTICLPGQAAAAVGRWPAGPGRGMLSAWWMKRHDREEAVAAGDRKSTRLNSSH